MHMLRTTQEEPGTHLTIDGECEGQWYKVEVRAAFAIFSMRCPLD